MIEIILVEPELEENIGFTCRAMKNMGLSRLVLINPKCDTGLKRAYWTAVHAKDVLKKTRKAASLDEAVKGAAISVAVTRRLGQWRESDLTPRGLAELLTGYSKKRMCIVFGREVSGLTNNEIRACDIICTIPSHKSFPSLNISHAVMVIAYELFQQKHGKGKKSIAGRKAFNEMQNEIISTLDVLGFFKLVPSWRLGNFFKKILLRAGLDGVEAGRMKKIFTKIKEIYRNKG
ncbi:RNA methyltransferase [Spirochaetota bacterium]